MPISHCYRLVWTEPWLRDTRIPVTEIYKKTFQDAYRPLDTICASSFSGHHQMSRFGPQMNKFQQVSSDHHQMSLARGRSPGLMLRRTLTCDLSHDAFGVSYPSPMDRQIPVKTLASCNFVCEQWQCSSQVHNASFVPQVIMTLSGKISRHLARRFTSEMY